MSQPSIVGRWIKVVQDGGTFLVEFHIDHTVTERSCFDSDAWAGKWEPSEREVRLTIGEVVTTLAPDDEGMAGREGGQPVRLYRLA